MSCKEKYVCTVPTKYLKIAEKELRETESRRTQALEQLRDLISKHPNIQKCRNDSIFLLQFLRKSKFNVTKAFQTFENYLIYHQFCTDWFLNIDVLDPRLQSLINRGLGYQLLERDALGRKVYLARFAKLNPDEDCLNDIVRCVAIGMDVLGKDEITQITGVIVIFDFNNVTLSHMKLSPLSIWKTAYDGYQNAIPFRCKGCYILNLPSFGNTIVEFLLNRMSAKFKERVKLLKSNEELHKYIDPKILPTEYGGSTPEQDMIDNFQTIVKDHRQYILDFDDIHTNFKTFKFNNEEHDLPGSFRKLEID